MTKEEFDEVGGGASISTEAAAGTSSATDVSLREYLEMRITYERQISDIRSAFNRTALTLQASEYERRLDALNHEAARLELNNARNVSEDTWREFIKGLKDENERTGIRFSNIESFQNKILGAMVLTSFLVPILTSIAVYVLTHHAIPTKH